jgi:hypothetical protein
MSVTETIATVMMRLVRFFENTRKKVYYCNGEKYDKKAIIKRKNGYK